MKDPLIEAIYQAYPRQVAKPAAIQAITKALARIIKEEGLSRLDASVKLMGATKEYASRVQGKEKKYIPYAQKWYNQESYNEDPDEWAPPPVGWKPSFERPDAEWIRENWKEHIEPEFRVKYDPDLKWDDYPASIQAELLHIWTKQRV